MKHVSLGPRERADAEKERDDRNDPRHAKHEGREEDDADGCLRGAIGAGVPAFMSMMFAEWMLPKEQAAFRNGLESYDAAAQSAFGKRFVDGSAQQQQDLLLKWDDEADKARAAGTKDMPPFAQFKTLVVIGYYTSQVGQDEELKASMYAGQNEPGGAVMMPVPMIL